MDYIEEFRYSMFLINRMKDDVLNEAIVTECVLLSQGQRNARTMKVVTEGFIDKAKEVLSKIVAKIAGIWKKFIESSDRAFKNTSGYLLKYKDIILRKKFDQNATITMYDYQTGMQKMKVAKVDKFDYNRMKDSLESAEKFQATMKWTGFAESTDKNKFEDKLKTLFRGGEKQKTFKGTDLNMSNIFDYCINYNNLKKDLKADIENINTATNDALELISDIQEELEKDGVTGEEEKPSSDKDKQEQTPKDKSEENNDSFNKRLETVKRDNPDGEIKTYKGKRYWVTKSGSIIQLEQSSDTNSFYSFISETISSISSSDDSSSVNAKTPSGELRSGDGSFANSNKNISSEDDDATKKREESNKSSIKNDISRKEDTEKDKAREKEIKAITDKVGIYNSVCGKVLAVKQTICEEIFREYMSIIKYHVKFNLGKDKDEESNKTQDSYTDYSYKEDTSKSNAEVKIDDETGETK